MLIFEMEDGRTAQSTGEKVELLYQVQKELALLKQQEMSLRKQVATEIRGTDQYNEASRSEYTDKKFEVIVTTSETVEFVDPIEVLDTWMEGGLKLSLRACAVSSCQWK